MMHIAKGMTRLCRVLTQCVDDALLWDKKIKDNFYQDMWLFVNVLREWDHFQFEKGSVLSRDCELCWISADCGGNEAIRGDAAIY